jgi:hypothetical protein
MLIGYGEIYLNDAIVKENIRTFGIAEIIIIPIVIPLTKHAGYIKKNILNVQYKRLITIEKSMFCHYQKKIVNKIYSVC